MAIVLTIMALFVGTNILLTREYSLLTFEIHKVLRGLDTEMNAVSIQDL